MIGRVIGNYEITNELARGGMGTVYRGRHLHLPREVVVKSILLTSYTQSAQQHLKARFRREAYIQSQLDHPNIVRVYEFFAMDDNYYLVMEYVPGLSLKELIASPGRSPIAQTVHLCKQGLVALNYAHNFSYVDESNARNRGIIHRDIKPANLLIDDVGRLKITDFGIVKVNGDEALTASGFQPGTVEYMSPEQLLGLNIDERSDIYSLGVTFYEMLTGRLPFPRSMTGSDWDVRKGHIELEPPPIRELRPDLHPALAAIIMRTLRKNPHDRFQSTAEFLNALREYEQYARSDGYYQPIPTGHLTRSVFAGPTIIDQTLIVPDLTEPFESTAALPSSPQHPLEGSLTIPIPPARAASETAPPPAASKIPGPPRRQVDSNPANRQVFVSVPVAAPVSKWPLPAAVAAALVLLVSAGLYFFSGRQDPARTLTSAATRIEVAIPSPYIADNMGGSRTSPPANDNPDLKMARDFEQREHYLEAIREYERHQRINPAAADAKLISDRLITLRRFQGLIAAAGAAFENNNFAAARQNYTEALKIIPESQLAKSGLSETEARIKSIKIERTYPEE